MICSLYLLSLHTKAIACMISLHRKLWYMLHEFSITVYVTALLEYILDCSIRIYWSYKLQEGAYFTSAESFPKWLTITKLHGVYKSN